MTLLEHLFKAIKNYESCHADMEMLTLEMLRQETIQFLKIVSSQEIKELYGASDGKAVGTYIEQRFHTFLSARYIYETGSSAKGIDFPALPVDLKVTSSKQPQSSSPFRSASQKVYGLGYNLIIFVYDKTDNGSKEVAYLNFVDAIFIEKEHTADYQTTAGLLGILDRSGNQEDIEAFLIERNLPLDDIGRMELTQRILSHPPELGYITISNALQWRLQYSRALKYAKQRKYKDLYQLIDTQSP